MVSNNSRGCPGGHWAGRLAIWSGVLPWWSLWWGWSSSNVFSLNHALLVRASSWRTLILFWAQLLSFSPSSSLSLQWSGDSASTVLIYSPVNWSISPNIRENYIISIVRCSISVSKRVPIFGKGSLYRDNFNFLGPYLLFRVPILRVLVLTHFYFYIRLCGKFRE